MNDQCSWFGDIQGMGSTWLPIFFFNHVCSLLINYVHADRNYASNAFPALVPDCSNLEPAPCTNIYSTNPTTGDYTFDSSSHYLEVCPQHQCTQISPTNLPFMEKTITSNKTLSKKRHRAKFRFGEERKTPIGRNVPEYTQDEDGGFIRPSFNWFCTSQQVNYKARVEINTGLAPGQKEDQWAQCQWSRTNSLVGLGEDCDLERWGCSWCTDAFAIYICAMAFPKCQPATGGLASNGTDIYGPDTLSLLQQKSIMYTITKPCRTICFNVIRMCDQQISWACHLKESRDWADYPYCNVAGDPNNGILMV